MASLPVAPGYVQPGKTHISPTPVGYAYPQAVASYPASSYPSTPIGPTPYPTQGQVSYPPVSAKKDPHGLPPTPSVGMSNYPYYYPKQ